MSPFDLINRASAVASSSFYTHQGKAAALAVIFAVFAAGSGAVVLMRDATFGERLAGASVSAFFGWGLIVALARLIDRRAALVIDATGVHDRRMKVDAPWDTVRSVRLWIQQLDAAKAVWIALDVNAVTVVRPLAPLWSRLRQATLERWGRPRVALNLQGLDASADDVLAAIARFRPDLIARDARG